MLKNDAGDVKMMRDANYIYIQIGKIKKRLEIIWFQAFFGSGIRTCILCMRNLGVRNASHCSAKGFFESFLQRNKKTSTVWYLFLLWQRYKDSNLKWRSQSPECYRYTIPLFTLLKYSITKKVLCQHLFKNK